MSWAFVPYLDRPCGSADSETQEKGGLVFRYGTRGSNNVKERADVYVKCKTTSLIKERIWTKNADIICHSPDQTIRQSEMGYQE